MPAAFGPFVRMKAARMFSFRALAKRAVAGAEGERAMASNHVKSRPGRSAGAVARESDPKTTRPDSPSRREAGAEHRVEQKLNRTLDTFPDRIAPKDWPYQPNLRSLPDRLVNCHRVPVISTRARRAPAPASRWRPSSITCWRSAARPAR